MGWWEEPSGSAVDRSGQLAVREEGRVGTTEGGGGWGGNAVAGSQSCPDGATGCEIASGSGAVVEGRRGPERPESVSSSAVFPYYSQRLNCRDTQAAIFLLSGSQEGRGKNKFLTCSFCSTGLYLACSGTNCVYLQKCVRVQLHRAPRRRRGEGEKACIDACVHAPPGIRADRSKCLKGGEGRRGEGRERVRESKPTAGCREPELKTRVAKGRREERGGQSSKEKEAELTLEMESLLVHSDGECAVVLIINADHSSLDKQRHRGRGWGAGGQTLRHVILDFPSLASLPPHVPLTVANHLLSTSAPRPQNPNLSLPRRLFVTTVLLSFNKTYAFWNTGGSKEGGGGVGGISERKGGKGGVMESQGTSSKRTEELQQSAGQMETELLKTERRARSPTHDLTDVTTQRQTTNTALIYFQRLKTVPSKDTTTYWPAVWYLSTSPSSKSARLIKTCWDIESALSFHPQTRRIFGRQDVKKNTHCWFFRPGMFKYYITTGKNTRQVLHWAQSKSMCK